MDFDFVEVGGSGALSERLSSFGLRVGPPFSAGTSRYLCLSELPALELLLYLLPRGRLRSLVAFAPDSHLGLHRMIRSRMLAVVGAACRLGVPAVFVCTQGCAQPAEKTLSRLARVSRVDFASCAFGCPWSVNLCIFGAGLAFPAALGGCPGCPSHSPAPFSCVAKLASFPSFVAFAAEAFATALAGKRPLEEASPRGLESILTNDVLCSHQWFETRVWAWPRRNHINVFESEAALQVYRDLCRAGGDLRFNAITDSSVTLGSHSKGRSSAFLLGPSLRKAGAILVAGGLSGKPLLANTLEPIR